MYMNITNTALLTKKNTKKRSYLSVNELVDLIVNDSDTKALNHLLTVRKLFWYEGKRCCLPEYLLKLRQDDFKPYIFFQADEKNLEEKLDMVYDRTMKKFSQLRPLSTKRNGNGGPYCSNQYFEFSELFHLKRDVPPKWLELEREAFAEKIFYKLVKKHLKFSFQETWRITNRFNKRYRWNLSTGTIELKRPHWMKGHDFSRWLEVHIDNPDPYREGETKYF